MEKLGRRGGVGSRAGLEPRSSTTMQRGGHRAAPVWSGPVGGGPLGLFCRARPEGPHRWILVGEGRGTAPRFSFRKVRRATGGKLEGGVEQDSGQTGGRNRDDERTKCGLWARGAESLSGRGSGVGGARLPPGSRCSAGGCGGGRACRDREGARLSHCTLCPRRGPVILILQFSVS